MEIRQIAPTSLEAIKKKRVAVYARVSSDKDAAENSLEAQLCYFRERINSTPNWIGEGFYVDDGISGTKEDRPGFQRMMTEARNGKIDIIITKSITRFARNTVVLLDAIRELKSLGIDVIFENDHVSLNSVQGELLISLLAAHAEEQSRSASDNKRWQIKRDFENGRPTFFRIYGYKWVDGTLKIIPNEAKIVRRIYAMYLDGKGCVAIARTLNDDGITIWGSKWQQQSIRNILKNEKYAGNLLLQKWHTPDFRTKKQVFNHGEWRQYLVKDTHKAIVDMTTFEAVQEERKKRKAINDELIEKCPSGSEQKNKALFRQKLRCGKCGEMYYYKNQREKSNQEYYPVWICRTYMEFGKAGCNSKRIRESILIEKTREVLGLDPDTELTRELIDQRITAIESAADNRLRFLFTDGSQKIVEWENPSRSQSWTPEMREQARENARKRKTWKRSTEAGKEKA